MRIAVIAESGKNAEHATRFVLLSQGCTEVIVSNGAST